MDHFMKNKTWVERQTMGVGKGACVSIFDALLLHPPVRKKTRTLLARLPLKVATG